MSRTSIAPTVESSIYSVVQSLPEMWSIATKRLAAIEVVCDLRSNPAIKLTYAQLYEQMQCATGLQVLGIESTAKDFLKTTQPTRAAISLI